MGFLLTFIISPAISEESNFHILEFETTKDISIYDKYNDLIPLLIEDLKNCGSNRNGEITNLSMNVINYGKFLEECTLANIDECTIKNDMYWKAFFTLTKNDITVLLTRLFMLMRNGEIKRAEMLLLYCLYDQNPEWNRDKMVINSVANDINYFNSETDQLIQQGIEKWDSGERDEAINWYRKALELYPKNPHALYELCLDFVVQEINSNESRIGNEKLEQEYQEIRRLDPFFTEAFQGKATPELSKAAIAMLYKAKPSYEKLWKGENILENMNELGDGYFEMGEFEFAIYAYKYLLFETYDDGFDDGIVEKIYKCLNGLNIDNPDIIFGNTIREIDEMIKQVS